MYSQTLRKVHDFKSIRLHVDTLHAPAKATMIIRKDAYLTNLAFFCKQELKIEKALRVPLRFRVGSLADCNFLEGKK